MNKRVIVLQILCCAIILCVVFLFCITCYSKESSENIYQTNDAIKYKTFSEIPGITKDEIASIEALKSSRESFSIGTVLSAETFLLPDGTYSGFTPLLGKLLSDLFEIPFVLNVFERNELIQKTDNMQIDFFSEISPTSANKQKYFMSSPITERSLLIFVREDTTRIKTTNDLDGLKIGFLTDSITEQSVKSAYSELMFEALNINSINEAVENLLSGKIDAIAADENYSYDIMIHGKITSIRLFPLIYTPVSFSTANSDLQPVISVINKFLEAGGIDVVHNFYVLGERMYANYMFDRSLTPSEQEYIDQIINSGERVKITIEPDNYPLTFYNENYKEFQGIAVDILKEITYLSGIEFEAITNKNTTMVEILEILKKGDAAFDAELIHTKKREDDFLFSKTPYFNSCFALISKTSYPDLKLFQVANTKVGVVKGTAPAELYSLLIPNSFNIIEFYSRNDALDALEKNKIDLFMTTDYMLFYQTHFREKTGYKVNILLNTITEKSHFGFNKNEEILCSIIEKAQSKIDVDRIARNWTNRTYDYSRKIALDRFLYMSIFTAGISILLIILIHLFIKNKKMIKKIDRQNDLLKTVNHVSTILLEPDMVNLENKFILAMSCLAKIISVDRVTIWKNHYINEDLYSSLIYEWPEEKTNEDNTATKNVPYNGTRWENILLTGECINSAVADLPEQEQRVLKTKGVISIFIAPIFINNLFWGYIGFDDCRIKRVFSLNESMILQSAGRMLGNAYIRNEMTQSVIDTTTQLETAVMQANEASRLKNISFNSMKNILNSIDSMIYVTNPETCEILFMNNSMMNHYGINEDCTGKLCYSILQANRNSKCEFCPCYRLDKAPDKPVVWEEHSTLTNRIYYNVDRYIDWADGQTVHIQHSVDMTELIEAREKAEESSRYKSAFLATMSHEIRTPMNAILGVAEIQLQNKNLPEEIDEAFNKIYESGDLLLHIINDILDFSKIEAGKLEIIPLKYDIPSLINDAAQLNRLRYESKPIWFSLYIDENTPHDFYGDELRLKQILNNILSNAFKYTDEGSVELYVFSEDIPDSENVMLVFRIVDTGQGMSDDQLEKLYDEYTRFNLEANRTTVGAGLGMNITKRLVDLMDGTIKIHSEVGKGTVFTIKIPQKRVGAEVCGPELAERLRNFRYQSSAISKKAQFIREYMPYGSVLVVDDVESNIYVIKGMLMPYSIKIDTVFSGYDAIEKIKNKNVYDIIFMDHMMPKMDGIETTKIIRNLGYNNPIIALTANALVGREEMFLQNGFDAFISKPIDSRELNHLLNEYIRNRKPIEVIEAARDEKNNRKIVKNTITKKSEIESFFINDAENAVNILENIDIDRINNEELELYVVTVHGIKSALANIEKNDLSNTAFNLEKAGRDRNLELIKNETPDFIINLKSIIRNLKSAEETSSDDVSLTDEDKAYLSGKLFDIKTACANMDKGSAKSALKDLKQRVWSNKIKNDLENISVYLLHSDFNEAAILASATAEKFIH